MCGIKCDSDGDESCGHEKIFDFLSFNNLELKILRCFFYEEDINERHVMYSWLSSRHSSVILRC